MRANVIKDIPQDWRCFTGLHFDIWVSIKFNREVVGLAAPLCTAVLKCVRGGVSMANHANLPQVDQHCTVAFDPKCSQPRAYDRPRGYGRWHGA
jgi:hypothetical protein